MLRIVLSLCLVLGVAGVVSAQQPVCPGPHCPNCPPVVVTPRVTVYPRPYYPRPYYYPPRPYRPVYVYPGYPYYWR